MRSLLLIGLLVSLAASPLLLALFKRRHFESWALVPRLALWAAVAVAVVIAIVGVGAWRSALGVAWPTWGGAVWAVVAAVVIFVAMGVLLHIQQRLGVHSEAQFAQHKAILGLPFGYRCFIVLTAAITEEVLYRAYAVGVGQFLFGSLWVACVVSVAAFTLAHYKWGIAHMLPVVVSAVVLTLLFAFTRNIWLCIFAHALVDGVGILAMPVAARRRAQLQQKAG